MKMTEFGAEMSYHDLEIYREALLWGRISASDSVRTYAAMLAEYDCTEASRAAIKPLMQQAEERRDRFKAALDNYNDVMSGRTVQAADYKELPA